MKTMKTMNYAKYANYTKSFYKKNPQIEKAKKLIFNFITLNALMFVISIISTACANTQPAPTLAPVIDNNQPTQNQGKQPSISLAETAEANETTEDMRTPSASSANMQTQPDVQAITAPAAIGSIQKTQKKPTVTDRLNATLKAPPQTIKGTTILEETAQGTYIHLQAQGLDPKSSYNLSLYDMADCQTAQLGKIPQAQPERILAKLPMSKKGNIKFSQFFEGLKVNGESGLRSKSIIITENIAKNSSQTLENSKTTAACVVLSN